MSLTAISSSLLFVDLFLLKNFMLVMGHIFLILDVSNNFLLCA